MTQLHLLHGQLAAVKVQQQPLLGVLHDGLHCLCSGDAGSAGNATVVPDLLQNVLLKITSVELHDLPVILAGRLDSDCGSLGNAFEGTNLQRPCLKQVTGATRQPICAETRICCMSTD